MRLIDADALARRMYHDAFEMDSDLQKWDGGCWVRYKMFENAIKDAPTIEPEQRWIPCSERLPEEKKDVLAVDDEGFFYIAQYSVYNKRGFWEETTEYLSIDAVAWQPLPEPWKGE